MPNKGIWADQPILRGDSFCVSFLPTSPLIRPVMRNLDQSIIQLYQADNIDQLCSAMEELIGRHIPCLAFLIGFRPGTFRMDLFCSPSQYEEAGRKYVREDYKYDIWRRNSPVHPRVVSVRHSDFTPTAVLLGSAYYRRVLKPIKSQYGASLVCWLKGEWLAMVTLHRTKAQGDFGDKDMALLRSVQPHFARVVRRLAAAGVDKLERQSVSVFVKHFPGAFLLLHYGLGVLQCNDTARMLCHEIAHGAVQARITNAAVVPQLPSELLTHLTRMRKALSKRNRNRHEKALRVESKMIPNLRYRITYIPEIGRGMSEGLFLVVFERLGGKALVPEFSLLTQREQEVTRAVADGRSNTEIAHLLGKSAATVRHQLSSALRKLRYKSRYEVIRLLNSNPK